VTDVWIFPFPWPGRPREALVAEVKSHVQTGANRPRLMIMLEFLEFISGIFEFLAWWRFYLCLLLSLALVGLVYWLVPDRSLCLPLSIPVAAIGIGTGMVWQWRKR